LHPESPMLKLIFRSSWKVQAFLAVLCFALATLVFFGHRQIEAEKAQALKDGIPAPVSLNAFDPKRDIHAADEVNVVGWINPDYNYLLTETTKRKRGSYDTVRRMFVLLGPDEPPRVYRRVSGSIIRLLFRQRSSVRRMPPLLLVA
jgi:hypothetical protein